MPYLNSYTQHIHPANLSKHVLEGYAKGVHKVTRKAFQEYKNKIFQFKPNIAQVVEQYGQMSLFEFTKSHTKPNTHKEIRKRRKELIAAFDTVIKRVLGTGVAASVALQLKDNDSVSTLQHASPLGHPRTLNSTLQNALPYFNSNNPAMQNVIVLSCAGISYNNIAFPRGHYFHARHAEKSLQQFTFFGHTVDSHPVMFHQGYDHESIKIVKSRLAQLHKDGILTEDEIQKISFLVENSYDKPHPLTFESYMDQLTLTNFYLFKKLFAYYPGKVPNLIFLAQESIALELLKNVHLHTNTIINQILFNPRSEKLLTKYFNGIQGAFSKKEKIGTYLFWAIPPGKRDRTQLWKKDNFLVSSDGSYRIELTPEALQQAIARKEIFPGVLLTFMILAFYYGLSLQGGVDQTRYLTQMKEGFLAIARSFKDQGSASVALTVPTMNLINSRPALAFIRNSQGERIAATGIDLLLHGQGGKAWNEIIEASKITTVEETAYRAFPSLYDEYVPDEQKDPKHSAFTQRDIEIFTGIDEKTPVWNNF